MGGGRAQPPSRADCEAAHPAAWGQAGKDVVWVPTPDAVVHAMLTMANVTPQDLVLDLGAGDGKIAIAAAKPPFGARSGGIEYDPRLAKLAGCLVQAEGVADMVRIVEGDIFKEDLFAMADWEPDESTQIQGRNVYLWITRGRVREPLLSATVRGRDLRFGFDTAGVTAEFAGTVRGSEIAGELSTGNGGGTVEASGALRGALRGAPWAEMPAECGGYYGR